MVVAGCRDTAVPITRHAAVLRTAPLVVHRVPTGIFREHPFVKLNFYNEFPFVEYKFKIFIFCLSVRAKKLRSIQFISHVQFF